MTINNLNPRRTVWFSPHEPSNKYDIWLSKNAHYDENGESTTDSNAQRDCDYIFKIYDCGKWLPIVGFNSTAKYKINIVEGNTLYHPAIFTGENPNDLYDAGTLGSLLSNSNFVTEQEWHDVFNSSNYDWGDIFGDTNWFGDLTWSIIQGGSSDYHIPWADTDVCGGIYSDTFGRISQEAWKFKGVECAFYPNYQLYADLLHRLCVNAYDMKQAFNDIDRGLYDEDPTSELIVNGWKGVLTEMRDNHSGVWIRANVENVELGTPPTSLSITNSTVSGQEDSIVISGTDYTKVVGPYEVFNNSSSTSYNIDISSMLFSQNTNPIYLSVNANAITLSEDTKYICDEELFIDSDTIDKGKFLITIQFGIVKVEKINQV